MAEASGDVTDGFAGIACLISVIKIDYYKLCLFLLSTPCWGWWIHIFHPFSNFLFSGIMFMVAEPVALVWSGCAGSRVVFCPRGFLVGVGCWGWVSSWRILGPSGFDS